MQYQMYSRFYDNVEGDQSEKAEILNNTIKKYSPDAKTVLEIACGTGLILEHFKDTYDVSGLDISKDMLAKASKRLPDITLYEQDMTNFEIDKKFDVLLCVYDSMNHLLKFSDWEDTFEHVSKHLTDNGIFIFDMNTVFKLEYLNDREMVVREFDENYLLMEVFEEDGMYRWNVKIFEKVSENNYELHEEDVFEAAFPLFQVQKAAQKYFTELSVTSFTGEEVTEKTGRVLFVYKKPN